MRGVIFDLDGTLVDSLADIAAAMDHTLDTLGLPGWSHGEYERFVGEGARVLVRRALGARVDLEDEALARFREHYAVHTRAFPGIDELLEALAACGAPTAVLSNKPHPQTRDVVRALFPRHAFIEVLGEREGYARKPDPASALELARAMERAPEDVLFVGDTPIDVQTARGAGMRAVGVGWGMRAKVELESAGVDHVIDAPDAMLPLLEQLTGS